MKPYIIHVADEVLEDLRIRLHKTRWPEGIQGVGWKYGADYTELRELCAYWRDEYDWRRQEARLNRFPQFVATIDGLDFHFFYVRSRSTLALPLLLLHGWPGSNFEFLELFGPLTDPGLDDPGPVFDLVVPSMPGFGFSGKPTEPGWHADRIARAYHSLMTEVLGFKQFGIQGGDWGTIIGTRLAAMFPNSISGLHINMPFGYPPNSNDPSVEAFNKFMMAETGYLHVQNTKPDTLTLAQADSPAGLAAWVLEKFHTWTDSEARLLERYSADALLTNLMFYWAPNSIASAARVYFESASVVPALFLGEPIRVPTGIAAFHNEPYRVPQSWLEPRFSIVRWTEMPRGGHFAALEEPQLLLAEIRQFFASLGRSAQDNNNHR